MTIVAFYILSRSGLSTIALEIHDCISFTEAGRSYSGPPPWV